MVESVYSSLDKLHVLADSLGVPQLAQSIEVDLGTLAEVMSGDAELSEKQLGEVEHLFGLIRDSVFEDGSAFGSTGSGVSVMPVPVDGSAGDLALGVDLDGDRQPDVRLYGMVSGRPGLSWSEDEGRKMVALRNARALAVMTMFRLGMTFEEHIAALGLVSQIELALISYFRESVPEPGHNWDAQRRAREIERRLARLRWVEAEQRKSDGGFRGVWNWLIGKPKLTGKLLYDRMIENADGMLAAMKEDRYDDLIHDVIRFTGVDP